VQIIAHSAFIFSIPRNRNCRNPLACLTCPNTGYAHSRSALTPQESKI